MKPGETDNDKKTISFPIFDSDGLPASGETDEGAVATVTVSTQLQISTDYGGSWADATGTFAHGDAGFYKYRFHNDEVATGVGEKNVWLRYKRAGWRTQITWTELRYVAVDSLATDSVDADAIADDAVTEIQSGLATAAGLDILNGLHQRNSVLDGGAGFPAVQYSVTKELTAARRRVFANAAAALAATLGAADDADGEIARYAFTGTGTGTGLTASFRFLMDLEP